MQQLNIGPRWPIGKSAIVSFQISGSWCRTEKHKFVYLSDSPSAEMVLHRFGE